MRLLYLSDTHIQRGRPARRKDDFFKALLKKFTEVVSLCRKLEVDYVIHGGDLFDQPKPDQGSIDLFCRFLRELDLPVYCVAGNHDLIEQQLESLENTALGYLSRNHLVKLIQPGERIYLNINGCVIQLSGQHFYRGIDRLKNSDSYIVKKSTVT